MNREAPRQDFSTFDASLNQQAKVEDAHSIEEKNNQRLRHKVRELFRERFLPVDEETDGGEHGRGAFGADDRILEILEAPMGEDNRYTKEQHERVLMFFDELVDYAQEQRRDPEQRQELLGYLSQWREAAFSVSPNISNFLSLEDHLLVSARLAAIPEAQATIASTVMGELVYDLQYMNSEGRRRLLRDSFTVSTLEESLDVVNYFATIGADALAQGWADDLYDDVTAVLEEAVNDPDAPPFIHYTARAALERLESEEEYPTRGVVVYAGDRGDAIASTEFTEADAAEHKRVAERVSPDENSYAEGRFGQIAKEAVGTFDHSGTLQSLAFPDASVWQNKAGTTKVHFEPLEHLDVEHLPAAKGSAKGIDTLRLLQVVHRPQVRRQLESDLGVPLKELTLREQIQLLSFLVRQDYDEAQEAFATIKKFGTDSARTFLALESGENWEYLTDVILRIADRYSETDARAIFAAYARLADLVHASTKELSEEVFVKAGPESFDRQKMDDDILRRAKDLLVGLGEPEAEPLPPEQIERLLKRYESDAVLFASIFKTAFKGREGQVDFSEMRGLSLERRAPSDLTPAERAQMLTIFDENWSDQDPIAGVSFKAMLEKTSDPTNKDTHFYLLKRSDNIGAFLRFDHRDDLEPRAYYGGSFNVAPALRGSAIGEAFFKRVTDQEAGEHTIYAHVIPDAVVGARYVEDGSLITGVDTIKIGDKETVELALRRDDRRQYRARQSGLTTAELQKGIDGVRLESFRYPEDKDAFLAAIKKASASGEVVSRYWIDEQDTKRRYLAFESDAEPEVRSAAA